MIEAEEFHVSPLDRVVAVRREADIGLGFSGSLKGEHFCPVRGQLLASVFGGNAEEPNEFIHAFAGVGKLLVVVEREAIQVLEQFKNDMPGFRGV